MLLLKEQPQSQSSQIKRELQSDGGNQNQTNSLIKVASNDIYRGKESNVSFQEKMSPIPKIIGWLLYTQRKRKYVLPPGFEKKIQAINSTHQFPRKREYI